MYGYIYLIVNKINGKTYVGQRKSNNWKDSYMGSGIHIKSAEKKYGIENFEKFLIQYCETKDELDNQEIFWIAEYRKRGKAEYNIANGGKGSAGHKQSDESKLRNRLAHLGKKLWPNGRVFTDSWKKHISEGKKGQATFTGKHHSEESKRKISESKMGHASWNKGLKNTWTCKVSEAYHIYKQNGGQLGWNDFQKLRPDIAD